MKICWNDTDNSSIPLCFSDFMVPMNPQEILLKYRFWLSRSWAGWGVGGRGAGDSAFPMAPRLCQGHWKADCLLRGELLVVEAWLVVHLCYDKIPETWVIYKGQKLVSHSSGSWAIQDRSDNLWHPRRDVPSRGEEHCVLTWWKD